MDVDILLEFARNSGVAILVLGWFMFRMEKKLDEIVRALTDMVISLSRLEGNRRKE